MREVCEMTHQKIVSVNDRSGRRRFVAGEVSTKAIQACPTIPPAAIAGMRSVGKSPHTPHQVECIFLKGAVGIEG